MKNMFQGLMLGLLVSFFAACNPHDSYCNRNEIALKDAAGEGDTNAIDSLCERGVDVDAHCEQGDDPAIVIAAKNGQLKAVKSLIKEGADVNQRNDLGDTALLAAATNGHIKIVNELILAGALVNEADHYGTTPLMWAAVNGQLNIVKLLIQHGADVNQRSNSGYTALYWAREQNTGKKRRELVRILKENRATEDCPRSCLKYAPCIVRGLGNGISFLLGL